MEPESARAARACACVRGFFCEVGCILAWTPITESKVLNYVLIAESTVLSTGAGLAASLSFGEIGADLLGMVGDNPFHSI